MTEQIKFDPAAVMAFINDNLEILDTKGSELITKCPFCGGGKSEEISFNINPSKGTARCWRAVKCGYKGTIVHFVKNYLDTDWRTAYGIVAGKEPDDIDAIIGILTRAEKSLLKGPDKSPSDIQGVISSWPSGTTPLWDSPHLGDVYDWIDGRRYDADEFVDSHQLFTCDRPRYAGRVLFKVETNKDKAYLAYAYDSEVAPKTLNPHGAVLSRMLYNYNYVQGADTLFVVEGIFDCARLMSWDFYAVAIFGVNLSSRQAVLLDALPASEIVVCLDHGAEQAAKDMVRKLSRFTGKRLSVMFLEQGDPDDAWEEDFEEAYLKRRRFLRQSDKDRAIVDRIFSHRGNP